MKLRTDLGIVIFCQDKKYEEEITRKVVELTKVMRTLPPGMPSHVSHEVLASAWFNYARLTQSETAVANIMAHMMRELAKSVSGEQVTAIS